MVTSAQVNSNQRSQAVALGPFEGGLHNSSGTGEFIQDQELFILDNLEVDTDKSLVNRPAIRVLSNTVPNSADTRLIGKYLPADGRKFLVVASGGKVYLVDPLTGSTAIVGPPTVSAITCLQFQNRLYIVPAPNATTDGGYFEPNVGTGVISWTAVSAIPQGESIVSYKQRLWIASGLGTTTNASQVRFSKILDGTSWSGTDSINVESGNGEKLVDMVVLYNDIIFFKQHSTYRFGYTSDPLKAELSKISDTIGTPAKNCAVTYDNNNVYVLHDNSVYELHQYTYTRISASISMDQKTDPAIYASDTYGLTLYRDRLFVRYYTNLYVYTLRTAKWSRWTSERKFSRIVYIPSADIGLDTAYAASASIDTIGQMFYFRDSRTEEVGTVTGEQFVCSIQTKTFDLDVPHAYKVLMFWSMTLATLGTVTAKIIVPNAGKNFTWNYLKANYTWDSANFTGVKWSNNDMVVFKTIRPSELGGYAKKNLKFDKKLRFRQAYITIETPVVKNTVADACVRMFDITVFVHPKQLVSKATT